MIATQLHMKTSFDHEKLDVYQEAIRFVSWADDLLESIPKNLVASMRIQRMTAQAALSRSIRITITMTIMSNPRRTAMRPLERASG